MGWRFARSLSQIANFDNMKVAGKETDAWRNGAGEAIEYGKEKHEEFFCDELGIDEADYRYMRFMVRLQHFMTSNDDYTYDAVYKMSIADKAKFRSWKTMMEEATEKELSKDEYLKI